MKSNSESESHFSLFQSDGSLFNVLRSDDPPIIVLTSLQRSHISLWRKSVNLTVSDSSQIMNVTLCQFLFMKQLLTLFNSSTYQYSYFIEGFITIVILHVIGYIIS